MPSTIIAFFFQDGVLGQQGRQQERRGTAHLPDRQKDLSEQPINSFKTLSQCNIKFGALFFRAREGGGPARGATAPLPRPRLPPAPLGGGQEVTCL